MALYAGINLRLVLAFFLVSCCVVLEEFHYKALSTALVLATTESPHTPQQRRLAAGRRLQKMRRALTLRRGVTSNLNRIRGGSCIAPSSSLSGGCFSGRRYLHRTSSALKAAEAGDSMTGTIDVRVATYNVLSSSLCEPDYFTSCKPENLDPEKRLPRIYSQLEEEIRNEAIICLQEISMSWAGPMHAFFHQRGIGLAFPSDRFESEMIDIKRLSDAFELPRSPEPGLRARVQSYLGTVASPFVSFARKVGLPTPRQRRREKDEWESSRRQNTLVFARLRDRTTGAPFAVATYHMPCAYFAPRVMTLHAAMAVTRVSRLAAGLPMVLAGDFNLIPGSEPYRLITEGELPKDDAEVNLFTPVPPKNTPRAEEVKALWEAIPDKFNSAYKEVLGEEPAFTNYAETRGAPVFIETLDYIFVSPEIKTLEIRNLPTKEEASGPYPTEAEPSDHAMLAATLRIPAKLD